MKIRRISWTAAIALVMIGGLIQPSVSQAAPLATGVQVSTKAVKKCTLKKGAACKGKGVTKQKIGNKNLSGVKLSKGKITGTKFTGTTLTKADFSKSVMSNTTFSGTDLNDANFKGAYLKNVTFDAGTNLNSVDFSGATLNHVTFRGALATNKLFAGSSIRMASTFDCEDSRCESPNFSHAKLFWVYFSDSNFPHTLFTGANVTIIDFESSSFESSDFSGASVIEFDAWDSNLSKSRFIGFNCLGADVEHTDFSNGNFSDASAQCRSVLNHDLVHNSGNRYGGAIGLAGAALLDIKYQHGPKPVSVEMLENQNGMNYNRVCDNANDCSINLQIGMDLTLKVWGAVALKVHVPTFSCEDAVVDHSNEDLFVSVCTRPGTSTNRTKAVNAFIDDHIHVVVQMQPNPFTSPTVVPKLGRMVIKSGGHAVQTCNQASTCEVWLTVGSSVEAILTSSTWLYVELQDSNSQSSIFETPPPVNNVYTTTIFNQIYLTDPVFLVSLSE